ncbi:MAG: cysteine--tRNA ligase [Dehalococcoidia bacterium]|nr:cysteine--tRNA ligase [Dehalococcoidia bacterium]
MPLRFTNTLSHTKEEFRLLDPAGKLVRMYTCGPTVYRFAHVGNLRSYLAADVARRVLEYNGYEVYHVKNITDVGHMRDDVLDQGEDKMVLAALQEGKSPWDIADFYTQAFRLDEKRLNILPARVFPKATDHIAEMISMTQTLLKKGFAYEVAGNVYYDVSRFGDYGKLSGNRIDKMQAGHRVKVEEEKEAPEDFALWKKAEPGRLMKWDSPWGEGFPGWHIECSAMSMKYLGDQLDIHTGGVDNIFPHHEDEIAQSEAATGKRFVRYWLHGEHLMVEEQKMAKSAGNFYVLDDLINAGFSPLAFRYLCLTAHYRSKLNFSWDSLTGAQTALNRVLDYVADWDEPGECDEVWRLKFLEAVNDDLDTARALAVTWDLVRSDLPSSVKSALVIEFDRVLGLGLDRVPRRQRELPEDILRLVKEREVARLAKDWAKSDAMRERLREVGVEIKDTPDGPRWRIMGSGVSK